MHKVFVYGSLKSGFGNNDLIVRDSGNEFLGAGVTLNPEYHMISLGGFPGVLKNGQYAILGELYSVNETTFKSLDRLEGNGTLYLREETEIVDMSGAVHTAWMYIFLNVSDRDLESDRYSERVSTHNEFLDFPIHNWNQSTYDPFKL